MRMRIVSPMMTNSDGWRGELLMLMLMRRWINNDLVLVVYVNPEFKYGLEQIGIEKALFVEATFVE